MDNGRDAISPSFSPLSLLFHNFIAELNSRDGYVATKIFEEKGIRQQDICTGSGGKKTEPFENYGSMDSATCCVRTSWTPSFFAVKRPCLAKSSTARSDLIRRAVVARIHRALDGLSQWNHRAAMSVSQRQKHKQARMHDVISVAGG